MVKDTRRSGLILLLIGAAGGAFFWATDPLWGLSAPAANDVVDAINHASPGTIVGFAGCAVIAVIGIWLTTR